MPERSVRMLVAQGCIIVVVLASFAGIFIHSAAIGLTAGAALADRMTVSPDRSPMN